MFTNALVFVRAVRFNQKGPISQIAIVFGKHGHKGLEPFPDPPIFHIPVDALHAYGVKHPGLLALLIPSAVGLASVSMSLSWNGKLGVESQPAKIRKLPPGLCGAYVLTPEADKTFSPLFKTGNQLTVRWKRAPGDDDWMALVNREIGQ